MKVGDKINWMGLPAWIKKIHNEDHYVIETGPEGRRYEVEIHKRPSKPKPVEPKPLPGWDEVG
jgi:hypothetical protein